MICSHFDGHFKRIGIFPGEVQKPGKWTKELKFGRIEKKGVLKMDIGIGILILLAASLISGSMVLGALIPEYYKILQDWTKLPIIKN